MGSTYEEDGARILAEIDGYADTPEPRPDEGSTDDSTILQRLNARYAVVTVEGEGRIWDSSSRTFVSASGFALLHDNQTVPVQTSKGTSHVKAAKLWREWPERATRDGFGFYPGGGEPYNHVNLWSGWGVASDKNYRNGCDLFLQHIREVACSGDERLSEWVLDYFADIVQNPQRKIPHALVLRGRQGSGKTVVADVIGHVLGREQYVKVSNENDIFGSFNAHMETALLVDMEELAWAGNRKHGSMLKDIISAKHMTVNQKNVPIRTGVPSYFRVVVTSNESWVIQSAADDRRWVVADVSNKYVGDLGYFRAMFAQLEDGGYEELFAFLRDREIDEDRLFAPPGTEALEDQALRSLDPTEAWWHRILEDGSVRYGEPRDDGTMEVFMADLTDEHNASLKGADNRSHSVIARTLISWLKKHAVVLDQHRPRHPVTGKRTASLILAPLADCRAAYSSQGRAAQADWAEGEEWESVNTGEINV